MTMVVIIVVVAAVIFGRQASETVLPVSQLDKKVTLVDAKTLRTDSARVSADGAVESVDQVELRSQISAPVTAVNVSIGDWVTAGAPLVTLQNTDILAELDQAKANLALAKAQSANAGVTLESAVKGVIDKVEDAYVKVDDAIHTQSDQFFSNPSSNSPKLIFVTSDLQLVNDIERDRVILEGDVKEWKESLALLSTTVSGAELDIALMAAKKNLNSASKFLDEVSAALNGVIITSQSISASLPGWKISISAARASISGAIAGVSGAEAALSGARSALKNPDDLASSTVSISTTEAQIMAAEAVISNLKVQLAKTIISTPISGRIASIPIKTGELLSPGQIVASVINTQSLQIKAFVSDSDYSKIGYGSPAYIQGKMVGTVTKVAPSIDPSTKKVEVRILVDSKAVQGLVIGQNLNVQIIGKVSAGSASGYLVPIQDVKIVPGEAFVYSVDSDLKVKKNPVILGEVRGDFVEIKSGLNDEMRIVSPVYELEEGDKVMPI